MIEDFKKNITSTEYLIYLYILKKYKDMTYEIPENDLNMIIRFIKHNDFGYSKEYINYLLNIISIIVDDDGRSFINNQNILYFFLRTTIGNKRYNSLGSLYENISEYIKEEEIQKVLEKLIDDKVIIKASDWCGNGDIYVLNNPEFK